MSFKKKGNLIVCVLLMLSVSVSAQAQQEKTLFADFVISGLETAEQDGLNRALVQAFAGVDSLPDRTFQSVKNTINSGLFELSVNTGDADGPLAEADLVRISLVARIAYDAIARGANPKWVEDLVVVGFGGEVRAAQIKAAADALDLFARAQIPETVSREVIAQALDASWMPETIGKVSGALVLGVTEGYDAENLALSLVIGIAQQASGVDAAVAEALRFVRTEQDTAYMVMKQAQNAGLPTSLGREIYYTAVENEWSSETLSAVLNGLLRGHQMGLSLEKLAIAIILRLSLGFDETTSVQIIGEEVDYVRGLDQAKRVQVQENRKLPLPLESRTRTAATFQPVFRDLMVSSVRDFLGTPYKWGGTIRRRGVDCSGFTQSIYRDMGVEIPRVSRDQFKNAPIKVQTPKDLRYGDLVFFNKQGGSDQYITHVGLFLGDDETGIPRFAHASSSKGVTISRFDKRYYKSRFVSGGRVAALQE